MNQKQTNALIKQYQTGTARTTAIAANQLWNIYHNWVKAIVGAHTKFDCSFKEDMLNEACVAFMRAIKGYDLNKVEECTLKTYASYWINGALINYLKIHIHSGYLVPRCSAAVRSRLYEESKNRNSISHKAIQSISKDFNIPEKRVKELEVFFCKSENISLNDCEQDYELCINHSIDEEIGRFDDKKIRALILEFIGRQNESVATVLNKRWLTEKKVPLTSLGKNLGQSYESIRQIEIGAFDSLMKELKQRAVF